MADFGRELAQRGAAIGHHLASEQVEGLDAVGAFVDLGDAHVAHQLLLAPLADVAVAAEYLLAVHAAVQADVGEEGLGQRGEQGDQGFGLLAFLGIGGELRQVQLLADVAGKGAAALGHGFHAQQHAPDVGVHDDRVGHLVCGLRPAGRAALQALAGVSGGGLIGGFGAADALQADRQALVVHHGEHRRQALVGLADQPALGTVEVDHAGARGLDAHLVFDRAAAHGVARAQAAIGIDYHLGHQKQRDALGSGRRARQLGQHQVDDVLGQVLLAAGDEDLAAADAVAAVGLGFGPGADDPQVGAGMGLGQAHGTGPAAFVHGRQVGVFQCLAGMRVDRQAGAGTQRRIQGEAGIGGVEHLLEGYREHLGHAHAAVGRVAGQADPAALDIGGVSLLEAGRGMYLAGDPLCALLVAAAVERGDQAAGDLGRLFKNGVGGGGVHGVGQGRQACPQRGGVEHFVEDETQVAQGRVVLGHGGTSKRSAAGEPAAWAIDN
ncbi:hypothetical protein D3C85_915820 [compost metagenome]